MAVARPSRAMAGYAWQETTSFAPFLWLKDRTRSLVVKANGRRAQDGSQLVGEGV